MTPHSEPEHAGLRPLGPWGEGCCPECMMIEGLTEDGRIEEHGQGAPGYDGLRARCAGCGSRPRRPAPYFSRKKMFKQAPVKIRCSVCGQTVGMVDDLAVAHRAPKTGVSCDGSWRRIVTTGR